MITRKGKDGLPHCISCKSEFELCEYHKRKLATALRDLKTPQIMGLAGMDIRYSIQRRWKITKEGDRFADTAEYATEQE